jgi:hypothetical protein
MLKRLGTLWGKLKITGGLIGLYIQAFNFVLLTITAYPVIMDWFYKKDIIVPFWLFEMVIFVGVGLILFVEYKFSLPGYYRASNEQVWRNDNPIRVELEEIRKENRELKAQLTDIQKLMKDSLSK